MQHFLVVDDDASVAAVIQMALEIDGTRRVTTVPGAAEALAAIADERPVRQSSMRRCR